MKTINGTKCVNINAYTHGTFLTSILWRDVNACLALKVQLILHAAINETNCRGCGVPMRLQPLTAKL